MKRTLIIACIVSMFSSFVHAQDFRYGFTGGVNLSRPVGDVHPDGVKTGILLGVKGELGIPAIAKGVYTDFEVQISAKGYKSPFLLNDNNEMLQTKMNIYYLNIPIQIGYKLKCSNSLSLFANVGPYFGLGLWGKANYYNNDKKYDSSSAVFDKHGFKRFDCGLGMNIGLEYAKHYQFAIGYSRGLKNISKLEDWNHRNNWVHKNRYFTFSLGYLL